MVQRLVLLLVLFFAIAGCFNRDTEADEKKADGPPTEKEILSVEKDKPCLDLFYNLKHFSSGACPHTDHVIEFQRDNSTATVRNDDEDRYPTIICRCNRPEKMTETSQAKQGQIAEQSLYEPPRCRFGVCQ